jgi:hypothetical protein
MTQKPEGLVSPLKEKGEGGSSVAESAARGTRASRPDSPCKSDALGRPICPSCNGRTFAKVDTPSLGVGWDNTKIIRCVECKRDYASPQKAATGTTPTMWKALKAAKALLDNIHEFGTITDGEIIDHADSMVCAALESTDEQKSSAPETEATCSDGVWQPTHRHVKRGTLYELLGLGMLQIEPGASPLQDYDRLAVYWDEKGGLWLRPADEFFDGRFEEVPIPSLPDSSCKSEGE